MQSVEKLNQSCEIPRLKIRSRRIKSNGQFFKILLDTAKEGKISSITLYSKISVAKKQRENNKNKK